LNKKVKRGADYLTTQKDVAEKAGVTVTTVSRVINNRGYISDETRKKVYKVMDELNYRPNAAARSLSKKKSNILGIILPDVSHPFFSSFLFHFENYAYQNGYKIMLCNSQLQPEKEREYLNLLRAQQVDGIFLASHTLDIGGEIKLDMPLITFDRKIEGIPYICSDNYQGGKLAAEHLIKAGSKKLVYIGGNLELDLLSNKRYEGFREHIEEKGFNCGIFETDINSFKRKKYPQLAEELFMEYPEVDGIFAGSDLLAAAVIKEALKRNINIPGDLRVIGYDGIDYLSLFTPEISSIRQPVKKIAKKAVEILIEAADGKEIKDNFVFDVELIIRETA